LEQYTSILAVIAIVAILAMIFLITLKRDITIKEGELNLFGLIVVKVKAFETKEDESNN